jgi:uncharacterized membrane protein YhaH (DUF805 family)
MDNLKELLPYVHLTTALTTCILAFVLTLKSKNFIGKKWLLAYTVITLITWPGYNIVSLIANYSEDRFNIYNWYDLLNMVSLFSSLCFGLFLFAIWSVSRMKLDLMKLLFSFDGRISRSALWITLCIFFPTNTLLGFAPFNTQSEGIVKIIIWIIYVFWLIVSVWISLAVYTKRWHDLNKSGWMTLVLLIPVVGFFWFFVQLGFYKGSEDANQYGNNPLNIEKVE